MAFLRSPLTSHAVELRVHVLLIPEHSLRVDSSQW